jgi:GTP-binding protein
MRIAIVGRRNVGKSTLANRFAKKERVVVSMQPGTTRDAVEIPCRLKKGFFIAIDTAGLRKKGKEQATTDLWSRQRTQQAIRSADVVLFLLDALEKVGEVDKRIAAEVVECGIPCVICINKWDLARGKASAEDYDKYVARALPALSFAPISFVSALQGTNVAKTLDLARELFRQAHTRVPTAELNAVVRRICETHLPRSLGPGLARIYYATQIGTAPVRIVIFVNDPRHFSRQYLQFLKHRLRNVLPFAEIPIMLVLKSRSGT